jgi:hypothetical protein
MSGTSLSDPYTVKFGRIGRTLEYNDAHGAVLFTFDLGSKGSKSLCLEHHPPARRRTSNYDIAFKRTLLYMQSCGYEVETFGSEVP